MSMHRRKQTHASTGEPTSLGRILARIDDLCGRMDNLETRFMDLEPASGATMFQQVQAMIEETKSHIQPLHQQMKSMRDTIQMNVRNLYGELAVQASAVEQKVEQKVNTLTAALQATKREVKAENQALREAEEMLEEHVKGMMDLVQAQANAVARQADESIVALQAEAAQIQMSMHEMSDKLSNLAQAQSAANGFEVSQRAVVSRARTLMERGRSTSEPAGQQSLRIIIGEAKQVARSRGSSRESSVERPGPPGLLLPPWLTAPP
jgi:hypothetical protein